MTAAIPMTRSVASLIGIDITPRAIELYQHARARSGERTRTARLPLSGAHDDQYAVLFDRAAAVLRRRGFVGRSVVVAAPADRCVTTIMDIPARVGELPVPKLVRMELAREHRLDPGDLESAWWELPNPMRSGNGKPVMSVGCPTTVLRSIEDAAAASGLHVVAVDSRSMALARGVKGAGQTAGPWQLVCDLSCGAPMVVVSHEGNVVIEHRATDISLDATITSLAGECRTDAAVAQALCQEVSLKQTRDRRTSSFALPRVLKAVRAFVDAVAQNVLQSRQYHHHRYGQGETAIPSVVVGEPWIVQRFLERMSDQGDTSWTVAPPGFGVARGLSLWRGEVIG